MSDHQKHLEAHIEILKDANWQAQLIPRRGYTNHPPASKPSCDHNWVDVGFTRSKIVCSKCDMEQR